MVEMQPAAARREQQRNQAREAILGAAEVLLADEGIEGFSMRRLAQRCGYTVPTIYHHFGDKPGLIDAVLEESFAELVRQLETVPQGDDPIANVRALAHAFVEFARSSPTHYRLLMTPRNDENEPPSGERSQQLVERSIFELCRGGRLRTQDPELARQVLWVATHGLISLTTSRPDYEWNPDLFDQVLDSVFYGLIQSGSDARPSDAPAGGND